MLSHRRGRVEWVDNSQKGKKGISSMRRGEVLNIVKRFKSMRADKKLLT